MSRIPRQMHAIPARQKIALIIFGLFLAMVLLEIGLRLGGFIMVSLREQRNKASLRQEGAYRIMCVGESTTQGQYPPFLEEILNQSGIGRRFSVIDEGTCGFITQDIMIQLEANLNRYRPAMVVAMMGINDWGRHMPYEAISSLKITRFLWSFRTYKLMKLLWLHIRATAAEIRSFKPVKHASFLQKVYYGFLHIGFKKIYALQKDRARKEEWVKKYLALKPIDDWGYAELGRICKDEKRFAEAGQMFKKALEFDPDNELTYVRLAWVYRAQGRFAEARQMLKKALELNPSLYMDFVPGALATLYWEEGRFDLARQCWQKASRLRKDYYNPVTVNNYHRLKEIIERRGIRLVCVQYPMRSLEPLKQIFAGEEGVIFVDNEEVFKDAIRKDGFDVYFVDMFAGDFGHCTPKGNRLLAENIARTILKEVFDVEEKQVSPISVIRNR